MEKTKDTKRVTGIFIGKYLVLGLIIGGISFLLENFIPTLLKWNFTTTFIIFQSVLFVISTLLTITLAAKSALKNAVFETKEQAAKVIKSMQVILIFAVLIIMGVNIAYYMGIKQSGYKDVETKYEIGEGKNVEDKEVCIQIEKDRVHQISNIYLAGKEIITIFTYMYGAVYIEKMVELKIQSPKKNKKE